MSDSTTPSSPRETLEARIANATAARSAEFVAKNYVEASRWDGRLDILQEWLASLAAILLVLFAAADAAAQVDDPLTPNKNEAITSSGYAPSAYVESPELTAALLAAAALIEPYGTDGNPSAAGKVLENCIGMSNAIDMCGRIYELLWNYDYKAIKALNYKLQRVAQAGHTAKEWANCADGVWTNAVNGAMNNAGTTNAVQDATIFMTQYAPLSNGVMTWAQLESIAKCHIHHFKKTRKLALSTIQWTGQSLAQNYAPVWSVASDDALMASYAGVHTYVVDGESVTIPVAYVPIYADGNLPNPRIVSPISPAGLFYVAADSDTDGIHPSTIGRDKIARSMLERELNPQWWYRTKTIAKPVAGPPPPPPTPAYGTLDNATRKLLSGACTVVWGALEAPLPASWCAGL